MRRVPTSGGAANPAVPLWALDAGASLGSDRPGCHGLDTVGALVALMDQPGAVGGVFSVGSSNEVTIDGLAKLVIAMSDSPSQVVRIPCEEAYEAGFEDMQGRAPDTCRIRELTGWAAERELEVIVRGVLDHERIALGF